MLWPRAKRGAGATYGATFDYRSWSIELATGSDAPEVLVGPIGSAFNGTVGGRNMARPPWGWFDRDEEDRRQGEWFLTPAETIKWHFELGDDFSTSYLHHPVFEVYRQ